MATGAAIGAGAAAIEHRATTGSWEGAGEAALNGMADGALSGAITGGITGAISSSVQVTNAAKSWAPTREKSSFKQMTDHYK